MKDEDSGTYLAGLFIARLIKSVQEKKQRNKKEVIESISVVNRKAEYSSRLRELEKTRRIEEEWSKEHRSGAEENKSPGSILKSSAEREKERKTLQFQS